MLVQVVLLERIPQRLIHLQKHAKAGRFLAAAVAESQANLLIFLGRHDLQQGDLLNHQSLRGVYPAEERDNAIGIFLLQIIVDIQQRVCNQLHPKLFDLVNQLKLQFVRVAQLGELRLARKQRLRVQIHLVVERAIAAHNRVKLFAVHNDPSITRQSCCVSNLS